MLDKLGCGPEDITHVSSAFRHDLMTAHDLGIKSQGLGPTAAMNLPTPVRNTRDQDVAVCRRCRPGAGA